MPVKFKSICVAVSASVILSLGGCQNASTPTAAPNQSETAITVSADDFAVLSGDNWSGTLSYLNYNSPERSTIRTEMSVSVESARKIAYEIRYPDEAWENSRAILKISRDGTRLNGASVISREQIAADKLRIVTQSRGDDDNRKADIRLIYTLSRSRFVMEKEVRFDGEAEFFNRNRYELLREG